jgi:hypothetical protein
MSVPPIFAAVERSLVGELGESDEHPHENSIIAIIPKAIRRHFFISFSISEFVGRDR